MSKIDAADLLLRLVSGTSEMRLLCPVRLADETGERAGRESCGNECVHIEKIQVVANEDTTTLDQSGTHVAHVRFEGWRGLPYYGTTLLLTCWCEGGHRFSVSLGFHKGSTYVMVEELSDLPECAEGEEVCHG